MGQSARTQQTYVLADAGFDAERERLVLLGAAADPMTVYELSQVGVRPGWQCLEVGAGAGTIARWLAQQVLPSGRVVATDIDTRFLTDLPELGVEVQRHNIIHDSLEVDTFDLIHLRFLLLHLGPAAEAVIAKLARSLKPGGWLLAEELDPLTHALATDDGDDARFLAKAVRAHWDVLARTGVLVDMGRRAPAMLRSAGLLEVSARGYTEFGPGGSASHSALAKTIETFKGPMIRRGFTSEEVDRCVSLLLNPSVCAFGPLVVATRGRRGSAEGYAG
jgi:SAM-dependent methyltransferase